ncbi:hypothetical protein DL93DRAFT_2089495 [Clavulina sp. PMI_390]|nr:hypothetical protein DL93DRAFT_2089495 [Clavulina sp. PMI_390]
MSLVAPASKLSATTYCFPRPASSPFVTGVSSLPPFVRSVLQLAENHSALAAYLGSVSLASQGSPGFVADLVRVLAHLPHPVEPNALRLSTIEDADRILYQVKQFYKDELFEAILLSTRSLLLWYRTPSGARPIFESKYHTINWLIPA